MCANEHISVDFFCIGAPKSGTTWLYHALTEHPGIYLPKFKEPNFFARKLSIFNNAANPRFMKDWEWYTSLFNDKKSGDILGDFSINLMRNTDEAPFLIKKHFPDAKIIVMLREPVARAYSHYWHERRYDHIAGIPDSFEEGIKNEELLFCSSYYEQLKVWASVFPLTRFFFIIDFELEQNPKAVLTSLFEFLNVNQHFNPSTLHQRINPASERNRLFFVLQDFMVWAKRHRLEFFIDVLRILRINQIAKLLLTKTSAYPPIDPVIQSGLRNYYLSDIDKLEVLIGKDLTAWKQ